MLRQVQAKTNRGNKEKKTEKFTTASRRRQENIRKNKTHLNVEDTRKTNSMQMFRLMGNGRSDWKTKRCPRETVNKLVEFDWLGACQSLVKGRTRAGKTRKRKKRTVKSDTASKSRWATNWRAARQIHATGR